MRTGREIDGWKRRVHPQWLRQKGWNNSWMEISGTANFQLIRDGRTTALDVATGLDGGLCVRYAKDLTADGEPIAHENVHWERVRFGRRWLSRWCRGFRSFYKGFKLSHIHIWTQRYFYRVGISETVQNKITCRNGFLNPV
jgi:hypothetical protein